MNQKSEKIIACDFYKVVNRNDSNRKKLEKMISDKYSCVYGADIYYFMEDILLVYQNNSIATLAGINYYGKNEFFLEKYLDCDLYKYIANNLNINPMKQSVVEIGNFISVNSGSGPLIIICLTHWLQANSYEWVLCTVTEQVRLMFKKLSLNIRILQDARQDKLSFQEQEKWGSYYEKKPMICAVSVQDAFDILRKNFNFLFRKLNISREEKNGIVNI